MLKSSTRSEYHEYQELTVSAALCVRASQLPTARVMRSGRKRQAVPEGTENFEEDEPGPSQAPARSRRARNDGK